MVSSIPPQPPEGSQPPPPPESAPPPQPYAAPPPFYSPPPPLVPTTPPPSAVPEWMGGSPTYPVSVLFLRPVHNKRWFAIPLIGFLARLIMIIPHLLVLFLVYILVYLTQIVLWLIVLLTGHYPKWGYSIVGGYIRWNTRLLAWMFGLTDQYPPFQLKN